MCGFQGTRTAKAAALRSGQVGNDGLPDKDEKGRHILQYVGTDVIRKQAPDFWVDFISSVLTYFNVQHSNSICYMG